MKKSRKTLLSLELDSILRSEPKVGVLGNFLALQSDDVTKRAESEEWLDNLQSEVKDIVDSIEEVFRKPWR